MQKPPKPSPEELRRQRIEAARAKADSIRAAQEQVTAQTSQFSQTFQRQPMFRNGFVRS